MITLITPTGDRPLAFALCQLWIKNQILKPDQWIVIDDGEIPLEPLVPMEYVRRSPTPGSGSTLIQNLSVAVPLIKGDKVFIIEDDEYYAPDYVLRLSEYLNAREVVGICRSKYYHLPSGKFLRIGNVTHASLAQTSFRSTFLPSFISQLKGDTYLDMRLWRVAMSGSRGFLFEDRAKSLYCGIKGLPGRAGIGAGHREGLYRAQDSAHRPQLREWVPVDFSYYFDILSGALTTENHRAYFQTREIFP